jgi:hypothetical protein
MFAGQRFCRGCGASTDQLDEEQTPTRIMPSPPAEWGVRSADTAPTPGQDTSPVYAPPQYYQPSVPPLIAQPIPPYQPPRSRSPLGWIIAFIGMGLFVALILAVIFVSHKAKQIAAGMNSGSGSRSQARADENVLDDKNADQFNLSNNETTITKTFDLDEDATFAIKNVNGSLTVETWNKPQAQVTVIKRGSEQDRGNVQIYFKKDENSLSLRTAYPKGSNKAEVVYQIKLPRKLDSVDLNNVNGAIKLSDTTADITAQTVNGLVDLANVAGLSKAKSVNGNIKAVLKEASSDSMEFENVNGNIEVQIKGDLDADLEAASVRGTITIDDAFGVQVQKQMIGQKASGQIGSGGTPLKLKTVNGSIKLAKQ